MLDCCDTNIAVDSPLRSFYITTQLGMFTSTLIQLFAHRSKLTIDSQFFLTIGNRKHVGKSCDSRTQKVKVLSTLLLDHQKFVEQPGTDTSTFICRYMDKRLSLQLNGSRRVTGILRGYDPFMNVVLDDTIEEVSATEKHNIGMVVSNSIPILVQPFSSSILLILVATHF